MRRKRKKAWDCMYGWELSAGSHLGPRHVGHYLQRIVDQRSRTLFVRPRTGQDSTALLWANRKLSVKPSQTKATGCEADNGGSGEGVADYRFAVATRPISSRNSEAGSTLVTSRWSRARVQAT